MLPVVQGGITSQVSVANLTAGRAVSVDSATITGGTANGVAYLNGSKVLTTGTGIQYSGGNLGLNITPSAAYGYEYTVTLDATNGWAGFGQKQLSSTNAVTYITNNAKNTGAFAWTYAGPTAYAATLYQQNVGQHQFYTAAAGTGAITFAQAFTIDANATVNTGNLVIGTAGKGIDFSAATHAAGMTSELLNDYEEGSFTPVLSSSGVPPTITSYNTQYGRYTKIGNRVFVTVAIRATMTLAGTGYPVVTGLPYSASGSCLNGPSWGLANILNIGINGSFISGTTIQMTSSSYNIVNDYCCFSIMYEA